jgi:Ca2+-transporting ATPase
MATWHTLGREQIYEQLDTSPSGLAAEEAARRLERYGPNEIQEEGLRSPIAVFLGQFTEVMVVVLLVAAAVSLAVGATLDAIMIMIIVILNAILGFTQEYRAERAMAALKKLSVPTVRVRRDDRVREVDAASLVPGDLMLLEAGDRVPADARVVESVNLRAEEAALTGESVAIDKIDGVLEGDTLLIGDQRNMVFLGTSIPYGRGSAVVVETGMRTQLGNIAGMLQQVSEERTPLQRRMAELGKWLAIACFVLVGLVFIEGLLEGGRVLEMFIIAVALAVAAVPEGLPAVVTIALSLGAQRMMRRHALIRKLPAVETLGSVTTICSDKTGTLTEDRMTVSILDVAGDTLNLAEHLGRSGPTLSPDEPPIVEPDDSIALLVAGGALANDAQLEPNDGDTAGYRAVGDPTEGAMVVAAARLGMWKGDMDRLLPRVAEVPFTSERKRMTTVHRVSPQMTESGDRAISRLPWQLIDGAYVAFTKGAVDSLLGICDRVWHHGAIEPLDAQWRERINSANDGLAQEGMRVLGVAMRPLDQLPEPANEDTLEVHEVFVGITGMIDPPRPEVREAVAQCRKAGIRPVMITGDHPLTALHIARDLGIVRPEEAENGAVASVVITGQQLAEMSVPDLREVVDKVAVYARVSPEHKVKLVEALKDRGHIVAMTGDGVNDAPALKRADIGVAMGITGTDVSKEASDMVLLDDNFASIVHAVEEGRTVYENIRKFILYMVGSNPGEIMLMLVPGLFDMPLPLTALQLLWINLVTDGLPALALGVEPTAPDTMDRPPHPPTESVLGRGLGVDMAWMAVMLFLVCFAPEWIALKTGLWLDTGSWRTMVFITVCLDELFRTLAFRSERLLLVQLGIWTNPWLLAAVGAEILLQVAVIYTPLLQRVFSTQPLNLTQWLVCLGLSTIVFTAYEMKKWIRQRMASRPARATS